MVGGKRLKKHTQLCTNEDVIRLCTEGILAAMRDQPDAFVFSVSQNDWDNHLRMPTVPGVGPTGRQPDGARVAVGQSGGRSGRKGVSRQGGRDPRLPVDSPGPEDDAPAAERDHPALLDRVLFHPSVGHLRQPANKAFREDLENWAKVSQRLWVWDYVTDFAHYLLPFPNQRVRNDNIQLYVKNNVKGIFEQDTYNSLSSEMAALGGYMTAKFLWNPDYDEETAIREFLDAYYGKAARPIRQYLDQMHDYVEKNNLHVNIWAQPTSPHLTDALLAQANALWEEAEKLVADDPATLHRGQGVADERRLCDLERARRTMAKPQRTRSSNRSSRSDSRPLTSSRQAASPDFGNTRRSTSPTIRRSWQKRCGWSRKTPSLPSRARICYDPAPMLVK